MKATETEYDWRDGDGDTLTVTSYSDGKLIVQADRDEAEPLDPVATVLLGRAQQLSLYRVLGDHLAATGPVAELPDATADGYDWPALAPDDTDSPTATSVLLEAQRAVYGPREADYGHPREDFTRQAILWTGLLNHKLADGAYIEAEDIARCMVAVKLARDVHTPKRDNRVDGAGYFLTLDRLETGK